MGVDNYALEVVILGHGEGELGWLSGWGWGLAFWGWLSGWGWGLGLRGGFHGGIVAHLNLECGMCDGVLCLDWALGR